MPWGPNGEWIWEDPNKNDASTPTEAPSHPYYGLAIRTIAPILSSEGGLVGATTAGVGERLAEWAEGSPENTKRILAETALGAIPGSAIINRGRALASAAKSAILSGAGEGLREWTKNGSVDIPDVIRATGTGALLGYGGSKFISKFMPGFEKAETNTTEATADSATKEVPKAGSVTVNPAGSSPKPFIKTPMNVPTEVKPSIIPVSQGPTKTSFPVVYQPGYGSVEYTGPINDIGRSIGNGIEIQSEGNNIKQLFATNAEARGAAKKAGLDPNTSVKQVTVDDNGQPLPKPRYTIVNPGNSQVLSKIVKSDATNALKEGTDFAGHVGPGLGVTMTVPDVPPAINKAMTGSEVIEKINDETAQNLAELQNRKNALANTLSPTNKFLNPDNAPDTSQGIISRLITDPTGELIIKGKKVRNVPTSVKDVAERTGVSSGKVQFNPDANVAASPVSGAVVASPEGPGSRQGYLFGEHSPQTLDKARRAGDTIIKFIKSESGEGSPDEMLTNLANYLDKNPQAALRLATGAVGAGAGALYDQDDPLTGALVGGAAGAALPSAPKLLQQLGVNPEILKNVDLTTNEGIKDAANKIVHTIPQIQRFNYLASITGLPANAFAGPYGAAFTGALEHALTGDPRGWKALSMLKNPVDFFNLVTDPATRQEAARLMQAASTPERALPDVDAPWGEAAQNAGQEIHDMESKGIKTITDKLKFPGEFMVQGDEAARHILKAAGFNEDEARLMTMTNEPRTEYGRGLAHFGAGNPLLQIMFPFRRTPVNMAEGGMERIPGLGFAIHGMQTGKKNIVDPMKLRLVQQALGIPAFGIGYAAGNNIQDQENARIARRFLTNLAGKYSLPVSAGFAAGQAHQAGKNITPVAITQGVREAAPLPSIQPITDAIKFAGGGNIPRGWVPEPIYDLLLNR